MRLVFAVTAGIFVDDAQRERTITIVLDGIRACSTGSGVTAAR